MDTDKTTPPNSRRRGHRLDYLKSLLSPASESTRLPHAEIVNSQGLDDVEDQEEEEYEENEEEEDEEDTFISIGVDFGTTYSGVAWSLSTSPNDVFIVSSWNSELPHNHNLEKVPSVVAYNRQGQVTSWGFSPEPRRHHLSWFKLGLSEEAEKMLEKEHPHRHERLRKLLLNYDKSPLDVAADYLRKLWEHAMEDIKATIDPVLWKYIKFNIVLSVPAIWDHKAQDRTRKAAGLAGMLDRRDTTLELIGEPEAAALAIFNQMGSQRPPDRSLKAGDSFVLCDAGGGTVDLISYRIDGLNPLKLAMCAEATGGFCGAIFLDVAFENLIRTMISAEEYKKLSTRSRRRMLNDWEHGIKRVFRMDAPEDEGWHVDIPGFLGVCPDANRLSSNSSLLSLRTDPGTLILKTGHLRAIFSEVCSKIKGLIATQLAVVEAREGKPPATILLVGGLGENPYLKQELDRGFPHIQVRKALKSWTAVCRGAVLKGLGHNFVTNHVSKYNYGYAMVEEYIEGVHREEDRFFNSTEGVWQANNQIRWFLEKGESVMKDAPVQRHCCFAVKEPRELRKQTVKFLYSNSDEAETRITPSVKPLCTLSLEFPSQVFDGLTVHINRYGGKWRKLEFILEMNISSGQLCWVARYNETEVGNIKMKVEYEKVIVDTNVTR